VREYTVKELNWAVVAGGFTVCGIETTRECGATVAGWVEEVLTAHRLPREHRGEQIYCLAKKRGRTARTFSSLPVYITGTGRFSLDRPIEHLLVFCHLVIFTVKQY
jgi:hypothetical protein